MSLPTETVSLAGSGLVFQNWYGPGVTDAYRSAILTAENDFQSHFTNAVTVVMSFDLQSMSAGFSARNDFNVVHVSYDAYVSALTAHATTADDLTAIAGLPTSDPSHGLGFNLSAPEARILGLAQATNSIDDAVVLSANAGFTFGQDAVAAIEHEMSEGVFGRLSSLGVGGAPFEPMDLFRFNSAGVRDYTGGADGQAAFFGIDASHVTSLQFHNSINAAGVNDGFDLGDWDHTVGDAFGPDGANSTGAMSATDLQTLGIIGWTPAGSASSVGGSAGSASPVAAGGGTILSATAASTQVLGGAGADTITGASVTDYLRGGDGDDSIQGGSAFDDINGNRGNDTIDGGSGGGDWLVGGQGDDLITAHHGQNLVYGNLGNDTLIGGDNGDILRGGQGDDSIVGGPGADFISGDRGNDTETGGAGADTFHFSQDAGTDRVLDFNYAQGDRVQLDPGTTYTVSQVGNDTIIDTGAGNEMILVGVKLTSLADGWIFGA
jgi:Ca2+-binding RTX toxin-like protein